MNRESKRLVLDLLAAGEVMTLATIRPDGYPQATTVAYANDGLTLYFACDRGCQKLRNLARSGKVSLTINREERDWKRIQGLSMGADAELAGPAERRRALALLARKFPPMSTLTAAELAASAVVKVTPKVISLIDYTKGFGHSELIDLSAGRAPRRRVRVAAAAAPHGRGRGSLRVTAER
ncbi:pyridoxamine 5'-phosphate oxidase family protein [Anaeromyxobacter oryzae]|uniref:Pyridoxamine 5'-phosphate oxidase n=1 Tax=Anaeromyxobacter oryzae TaxID=2918170 RepID=A0ABM7WS59_9BACT|nr:pyridoxamine 5'-phosphate oxidase family protein [Anaeromyxobacter oryzae]BDG02282.1 pyridoxamine 5'-phosphate oxidase [Anaeromyxobacter oryzae]